MNEIMLVSGWWLVYLDTTKSLDKPRKVVRYLLLCTPVSLLNGDSIATLQLN